MLVQTSMAHAFADIRMSSHELKKIAKAKRMRPVSEVLEMVNGALRAKVGTNKVNDQINLSFKTYKELRAQDRLPAYMM